MKLTLVVLHVLVDTFPQFWLMSVNDQPEAKTLKIGTGPDQKIWGRVPGRLREPAKNSTDNIFVESNRATNLVGSFFRQHDHLRLQTRSQPGITPWGIKLTSAGTISRLVVDDADRLSTPLVEDGSSGRSYAPVVEEEPSPG